MFVSFHTLIIIIQGNLRSVFPSLSGNENDILLLSMSGDDAYDKAQFQAPLGTETLGHVVDDDEVSMASFFLLFPFMPLIQSVNVTNNCLLI